MAIQRLLGTKVVVAGALALLFGAGVVVGFSWDADPNVAPPRQTSGDRSAEETNRSRGRIVDGVGLSAEQDALVDSLVSFHRARMRGLDREFRPRYRAIVNDLRQEIMGVLTEPQREQYRVLLEEHDEERRSRRSNRSR